MDYIATRDPKSGFLLQLGNAVCDLNTSWDMRGKEQTIVQTQWLLPSAWRAASYHRSWQEHQKHVYAMKTIQFFFL